MLPTKEELIALYRQRSRSYDIAANLYYLVGFREWAYRKRAVEALRLKPGATVVEVGCGTGLNFPLLVRAVGSQGRVVGVDISDAMLARARERVESQGWSNVELVQSDAAGFEFSERVEGVITTFAITLVPEFDEVIRRGVDAIEPGGRFVILDFKRPDWPPLWLVRLGVSIMAPFGVTVEMADRHPWQSLADSVESFSIEELYFGCSYIAVGEVTSPGGGE